MRKNTTATFTRYAGPPPGPKIASTAARTC